MNEHINVLELRAVQLTLLQWQGHVRDRSVLIETDNATVVAYVNNDGGTRSHSLNRLVREVIFWCLENSVSLEAVHVAGADNVHADALSRYLQKPSRDRLKLVEWSLDQRVANRLFLLWGQPVLDVFATWENRKVLRFCSRLPDPWRSLWEPWSCRGTGVSYISTPQYLSLIHI